MWTGDVQGGYPTQWALNPSAYQNLPNEQVDWATLAQQWIKMKETFPVDQIPPAPPPPSIKADIEAGEAPMDMSKDEITTNSSNTSQDSTNWGSWNSWQQWNWGWGGSGGSVNSALPVDKSASVPPYSYNTPTPAPSYSADTSTTTFDYNHGANVPENFDQQGYWSGGPAPFLRNKSSEWRGDNRPSTNRRHSSKVEEVEPDTTTLLDAAKRKQLPAWIREGLEKMEREKQKKLERERQLKEREEEMLRRKQEEEEALTAGIPLKSKFETDSEESDKDNEEVPIKPRRSRFDNTPSSPVRQKAVITNTYSPPPPVKRKTREEIMQDVMQQVRYILTDILMTVTNEEMQKVAEEVLADFRAKAPATQLRKTPALTSLTGKLGLGIYDSDSEDSSVESDTEYTSKPENGIDSDEELRERINRKRQEFARIERDIEHQVEQQEERERVREQMTHEEEEEPTEDNNVDKGQVEPKHVYPGIRLDVKTEESRTISEPSIHEQNDMEFTPERSYKGEKESSEEHTEDSDNNSSSKSESSSTSSSSSRYKKSRKSSKKRREKKSLKRKHKRSSSRGSDRRKSSHGKSSRRYDEKYSYERSRSRSHSRSRSRGHYDEYRRKRSPSYHHHSSESSHKRRHHSYSRSPDYSRGKKSSHRSRD